MLGKSLGLKHSGCASSSSNVHVPAMHLSANHEPACDAHSNKTGSSNTGRRYGISSTRNRYSGKLIVE
jgi:hypothetical protein